jgi:transcriptional regulator with XRE-family HTH domain
MSAAGRTLPRARVEAQEGVARVASWLRAEMRDRGLNQAETAAAMGVSLSRLQEWLEADPPRPTPDACAAIARFLGRPTEEILGLAGRSTKLPPLPSRAARPEVAAFSDWLSEELDRRGLTRVEAATAMGMHPRAMANWFGPHPRRPSAQMCEKLAELLGLEVTEVKARAGYPDERPDQAEAEDSAAPPLTLLPPLDTPHSLPIDPEDASDRVSVRLAILQTAASFLAHRPKSTPDDVEAVAARWERWVLREGSAAPEED